MTIIGFTNSLKGKKEEIEYEELKERLLKKYIKKRKKGLSYYEYFDMSKTNFKMFFDIDIPIDIEDETFDEDDYIKSFLVIIKELFNLNDEDYVLSSDCRESEKDGKTIYKVSYHIILQRKTNIVKVKEIINNIESFLEKTEYSIGDKKYPFEIDCSVYRNGLSKFRTLYSKKDNEINSLLVPYNDDDELKDHLLQITEGLDELDYNHLNNKIKLCSEEQKVNDYENTLNEYNIISTKELDGYKVHTIDIGFKCPFSNRVHKSNHCYIIDNSQTLYLKCFDEDCKGRVKTIFQNVNMNTRDFDIDVFNSIPIPTNKKNNYVEKKEYFEKYFVFLKDLNTYFRIGNEYNEEYDCYQKKLREIVITGYSDLKFEYIDENNKIKKGKFLKRYQDDDKKIFKFNQVFQPNNKDTDKYYNLFNGFEYENILNKNDEITEKDLELFDFYLDYIKKEICENKEDWFIYFISHFSSIIQKPCFLNHIIFMFYSLEQRTGKSSFIKFLSNVIGFKYLSNGNLRQLFDDTHTNSHVGTFMNIIEEISQSGYKKYEDRIKDASQRNRGLYNPKNKTIQEIEVYVRYFFLSNNTLNISPEDKRLVVFEFKRIEDENIVKKLETFYENKKMIYLFGDYLKNFNIPFEKRSDWIKNRPITDIYKKMIYNDSIKSFMLNLYYADEYFDDDYIIKELNYYITKKNNNVLHISTQKFYQLYNDFCSSSGNKPFAQTNFKKSLEKRFNGVKYVRNNGSKYYINLELLKNDLKIDDEYKNYIIDKKETEDIIEEI